LRRKFGEFDGGSISMRENPRRPGRAEGMQRKFLRKKVFLYDVIVSGCFRIRI
jgi:hypothetical protein